MVNKEELDKKRFISRISQVEGRGTELVSVYIPPDKNISDVRNHLISEKNEAANIKSKKTRNNVQSALSSLASQLSNYKETPDNGMVVFSGMIDGDKHTYIFDDLPKPVESFEYHCGSEFLTEELEDLFLDQRKYGLIAIDLNFVKIGWLEGTRISEEWSKESMIHSKHSAGGQSQARFERVREKQINEFFNTIAEKAKSIFYEERHDIDGLIIGGTSHTIDKFLDSDKLHHEIKDEIIGKVNVTNVQEKGLEELVNNSQELINESEMIKKKELIESFYKNLRKDKAVYGFDKVSKMLEYGAVETVIISDQIEGEVNKYSKKKNDKSDVIEFLQEKARNTGAELKIIPTDFEKGSQFQKSLKGIGAILRYNPYE